MQEKKVYRDLGLNDKITIEVPVNVALSALSEYSQTEWSSNNVNYVLSELIRQLWDPEFLVEREAAIAVEEEAHKAHHEQAAALLGRGLGIAFPFRLPGQEPE